MTGLLFSGRVPSCQGGGSQRGRVEVVNRWVRELRGIVTRTKVTSEQGTRRLVASNTIDMGKGGIARLKIGISGGSEIRIGNVPVCQRRPICCLFCGPGGALSSIGSSGSQAIIASFFSIGRQVCPVKELSCSAAKLLLLAGSNRFTGLLARPGCRVSGACITGINSVPAHSSLGGLRGKMLVSKGGASGTQTGLVSTGSRGGATVIRLAVRRN